MTYASGETPMVGDHIEDKEGRRATVIGAKGPAIQIRWDEGVVDLDYPPDDFFLVARAEKKP